MRATLIRPSKGFWGRSYDELKRLSNIAIRLEGVKGPSGPYELMAFSDPASLDDCKLMTDDEIGGFSTAELDWVPSSLPPQATTSASSSSPSHPSSTSTPSSGGYLRFRGSISTRLPAGRPDIQRTGYAAWRTADRQATVFGRSLWDVDSYAYLALRVRSDGRSYLVNVQTDSMVAPTDLHQHRLFARRPGQWETVVVPWSDFVRTNHGFVVEPQTELLRQKVRSVGLGLTDRVPGPFELCVARLWATNNPNEANSDSELPAETRHAVQAAEEEAVAAVASHNQLRSAEREVKVTANVPFAPPATTAASATSPAVAGTASASSEPQHPLKNKKGRPVRWDTDKEPPQQEHSQQ
ncbi:complex I intermediate-associated protein [Sporothrix brasiliensis 5110]|uniref:Complex I intermediate-associated protein n=1 Tax=Sporothrix brasiliensis 5110 TaxID=1398154 RepID=A0A0C2IK46_9PEZI|nr:complex I intermediate-associated protein [Sporothrix brasiliensis 5110]KIH87350.1 complex I intermediate-associated protein [Sporothrix brasiliensis 5110]